MAHPSGSRTGQRLRGAPWRFLCRLGRCQLPGRGAALDAAIALTAGAMLVVLVALPAKAALYASSGASSKPGARQPAISWQEVQSAAKAAHDAGNFPAYRSGSQRLFQLLSGNSDTVFASATAEAR